MFHWIIIPGIRCVVFGALILTEFKISEQQCFENPAVISSTQTENEIFTFNLFEIGKLILKEVKERSEESHSCTNNFCTFPNLQSLANSNSFLPLDALDNENLPIENSTQIDPSKSCDPYFSKDFSSFRA